MDYQPSFADDGIPDPHATGQTSYQQTLDASNASGGKLPPPPKPLPLPASVPSNYEPSFAPEIGGPNTDIANYANERGGGGIDAGVMDAQQKDATINDKAAADRIAAFRAAVEAAHPGGKFNPDKGVGFMTGYHTGRLDTSADRAGYINKNDPNAGAEVINVPGSGNAVIMPSADTPGEYHPLMSSNTAASGNLGSDTAAVVNPTNIATLIASLLVPQARLAEAGTSAALKYAGPGVLARAGIMGGVGGATKLADEEAQKAVGDNSQTQGQIAGQAGESAANNALGEMIGTGMSKSINSARGDGFMNVLPDVSAGVRAGKELNLPPITYGQMHPVLGNVQNLASRNSQVPENAVVGQQSAISNLLSNILGRTNPQAMNDNNLAPMVQSWREEVQNAVKNPNVSPLEAGTAAQEGMREQLAPVNQGVAQAYSAADEAAKKGEFGLDDLFAKADEFAKGASAKGAAPAAADSSGMMVGPTDGGDATIGGLHPQVAKIINTLRNFSNPVMAGSEGNSPLPVLNDARRSLAALANSPVTTNSPVAAQGRYQAARLLPLLDAAIANPTGGDTIGVSGAVQAAKDAAIAAGKKFDTTDAQAVLNADNPAEIMPKVVAPYKEQTLVNMKNTMAPDKWQTFKDGNTTRLMNDPTKIAAEFDEYAAKDPKALDALYTPQEQAALRHVGEQTKIFNDRPVVKALVAQKEAGDRAMAVVEKSTPDQITALMARDPAQADAMKHGLVANIIDSATYQRPGIAKPLINPAKLQAAINDAESSGKLAAILNPDEIKTLGLLRDYATVAAKVKGTAGISGPQESMAALDPFQAPSDTLLGQLKLGLGHLMADAVVGNKPSVMGSVFNYAINSEGKVVKPIMAAKIAGQLFPEITRNLNNQEPSMPIAPTQK